MMLYNWSVIDEQACREAEAIGTMQKYSLYFHASRVKRQELRAGMEQLEGRRKFDALFK